MHWPVLDGVRALAVAAVIVYHARPGWLPGGFLGVDVFFVLSGFLITSLLLREQRSRGRLDLRGFWLRRARRLLPALYVLLAAVLTWELALRAGGAGALRGDALAALGYVANWFLVVQQHSYFSSFVAPDALQHLWSLAVEEQFYLVWPLLLAAGLLRGRRALPAVLTGALASTLLCALLYDPVRDPSRVYYGTDTHSAGLLVGAALALLGAGVRRGPARIGRARRRAILAATLAGAGAAAGLVCGFLFLDETQPLLYRGGFLVMAACAAVLIGVLLHPSGRLLARIAVWRPLRWVGVRSYGIYLWHWPVLVLTSPHGDPGSSPLPRVVLQVAASVGIAAMSYRWIEAPIRSGAAWRAVRRAWQSGSRGSVPRRIALAAAAGSLAGYAGALGAGAALTAPPGPPPYQRAVAVHLVSSAVPAHTAAPPSASTATAQARQSSTAAAVSQATAAPTAQPAATGAPPSPPPKVTLIGDSVMLGAASALAADIPNADIDARVGRQVWTALDILTADRSAGRLGSVVVVHLGNNGYFDRDQFERMMQLLSGVRRVVVVNVRVPRPWQDANDRMLADAARAHASVRLVDWFGASASRPGLFWDDGTHLRPEGGRFYASLVAAAVEAPDPQPPAQPDPGPLDVTLRGGFPS